MPHPSHASQPRRVSRRDFIRLSALASAAGISLPALLSACASSTTPSAAGANPRGLITDASGATPVTLPLYDDNPPIPGSLPMEDGATLRVYQFKEYLAPEVLSRFEERYRDHDITVETTSFDTMDEALGTIEQPGSDFDVFFPSLDALGPLVQSMLLRPLNHDYLSNTSNLWPQFNGAGAPFFDAGMRYATPYTVYTTGIAWRDDLLASTDTPSHLANPFNVLWDADYEGKVSIYDSPREAISMAMLHQGMQNLNAPSANELDAAVEDLLRMADSVGLTLVGEGTYEGLTDGEQAVRQAWSGDAISARRYALDEHDAEERAAADHIRYYWQPSGVVGVDLTAILAQGEHPVLAHAFLDHLMDDEVAMNNFAWNGYQPATRSATPASFAPGAKWDWIVGPNLQDAIVSPKQWSAGIALTELDPSTTADWNAAWDKVRAASAPTEDPAAES